MKISCLFILLWLSTSAQSQRPDQLLDNWSSRSPVEKVYLHFDRENYIAGETTWFKAYLSSDYQPDTISTVLYTELSDAAGNLITRFTFPVILGVASGYIELPDTLRTGVYQVRSWSPTILNADPSFAGHQQVFIYGRSKEKLVAPLQMIRLEFFPEGGNLLAGVSNMIAFKATNENGLPAKIKGKVFNAANRELAGFETYHDGMGMFEFTPSLNEKYYAVADQDPLATKYNIPPATQKAIALSIIPHPEGYFFEIKQNGADRSFQAAYMIGQMQHHTVFRQEFTSRDEIQGIINTKKLPSGILQVTYFNKEDQPLAERLCFINNKEYILGGKLVTDTLSFAAKGRNRFSIHLPDTVRGSFSVSVTDADYNLLPRREENIYTALLLTQDLKGYIHDPSWYFTADNDSVKTGLDLVMMTNGWRRFKWEELTKTASQPKKYKDPSFITLEGKISLRDSKKPFDEKPLLMMLVTADSTRSVQMLHTDKQGKFRIDSMLFFGKSRIMFADTRGKKSQYIDAHLAIDSTLTNYHLPGLDMSERNDLRFLATQSKYLVDFEKIYREKGLLMEGVTVKAKRKKSPLEELDEKYASGAFATDARKVLDLVNTDESKYYSNVLDYLRSKGYSPNSRSMPSISALGEFSTELYLDEFLADAEILETLPMSSIAMIKIYSTFSGSWGNGPGGAIAIYTRKGEDLWNSIDARPATLTYPGFSVTKEFYAPDYAVKENRANTDTRITIDWRPDIRLNNINPRIPFSFYNNDRTKKFRVVVEGMTVDGKLLMIEEIISAKGF